MKPLFWIDLEMTGLNESTNVILEVAIVITDMDLKPLEEYHRIVHQPAEALANMDDWVKKTHGDSGLLAAIPHGTPLAQVEEEVLALIQKHYSPKDRVVLAGNSVGNDKRFIDHWMLKLAGRLHYRVIDVSSFKEIFRDKYHLTFEKKNAHRAVDDIYESIKELSYYLSFVQAPTPTPHKKT
jgi:oligoribonuclease